MKFGLASVLILVVLTGCGSAKTPSKSVSVRAQPQTAPRTLVDFTYRDLSGQTMSAEQFKGRVLVVSYFATWCAECLEQLPRFNGLIRDISEPDSLEIIAVSVDLRPERVLPPVLNLIRPLFKVVLADEAGLYGRTPMGTLSGVPTTFLIDKEGHLNETLTGEVPMPYLRRRILELMGGI